MVLNKYSHIIATSALEFGVMVRPQDVGFLRVISFFILLYFFTPFPNHHSYFHAVRVLHDNLFFFRNSHENVKSVVVWLAYSDKKHVTADTLTAGDDCSDDATLSDEEIGSADEGVTESK